MNVSEDDPRQPYAQVADDLRAAIKRGDLKPGQRIPSGRDLAKKYGVALLTIQRAVDLLKGEALVISHPPRGVFVARTEADDGDADDGHTPEYTEIMSHLDVLEATLRDHMSEVDRRLTALEKQVKRSPRSPKRGH